MGKNVPLPRSDLAATVVDWNVEKGYGWLQWLDQKVFLHASDYQGARGVPQVGEKVRFVLGTDRQGRPSATRVVPLSGALGLGLFPWAMLFVLLILPCLALSRLDVAGIWGMTLMALSSLVTFVAYASDKRRARTMAWRIPEAHLHLLELLGGWPGAWLAQRILRHKCSKAGYQFIFWCIVLCHQAVAYDSLHQWQYSRPMILRMERVWTNQVW